MFNNAIFEGEKSVRTVGIERERVFFEKLIKKFGFKRDIDLVTFCTSIAIMKEFRDENQLKIQLQRPKKLAGMETFDKSDFFDLIILEHLEVNSKRLKLFEVYFYTGFKLLRNWFENNDPDMKYEIERCSRIWDFVN